jgi:hypothetical protein
MPPGTVHAPSPDKKQDGNNKVGSFPDSLPAQNRQGQGIHDRWKVHAILFVDFFSLHISHFSDPGGGVDKLGAIQRINAKTC